MAAVLNASTGPQAAVRMMRIAGTEIYGQDRHKGEHHRAPQHRYEDDQNTALSRECIRSMRVARCASAPASWIIMRPSPEYAFKSNIALKANYFPPTNIAPRLLGQVSHAPKCRICQKSNQ